MFNTHKTIGKIIPATIIVPMNWGASIRPKIMTAIMIVSRIAINILKIKLNNKLIINFCDVRNHIIVVVIVVVYNWGKLKNALKYKDISSIMSKQIYAI